MGELDFLVVGHICRDVASGGYRLGGAAAYAAVTALRLGLRPGIVTRAVPQHLDADPLRGVQVHLLPSSVTTTFENVYRDGRRIQRIHAVAGPIAPGDVPRAWHRVPIVLLAPLAQEVHPRLAGMFPGALVGVAPQGWMRHWDVHGWVRPVPWTTAAEVLPHVRAAVLSEEDLGGDLALLPRLAQMVECLVCTRGPEGATLYLGGKMLAMPPRPSREVDPTGAGDVFAAAFLVRLWESNDPVEAARFANAAASFSVEGVGPSGVPRRQDVEAWLANHSDWGWPQGR